MFGKNDSNCTSHCIIVRHDLARYRSEWIDFYCRNRDDTTHRLTIICRQLFPSRTVAFFSFLFFFFFCRVKKQKLKLSRMAFSLFSQSQIKAVRHLAETYSEPFRMAIVWKYSIPQNSTPVWNLFIAHFIKSLPTNYP